MLNELILLIVSYVVQLFVLIILVIDGYPYIETKKQFHILMIPFILWFFLLYRMCINLIDTFNDIKEYFKDLD